jgi:hypothetical protein
MFDRFGLSAGCTTMRLRHVKLIDWRCRHLVTIGLREANSGV